MSELAIRGIRTPEQLRATARKRRGAMRRDRVTIERNLLASATGSASQGSGAGVALFDIVTFFDTANAGSSLRGKQRNPIGKRGVPPNTVTIRGGTMSGTASVATKA